MNLWKINKQDAFFHARMRFFHPFVLFGWIFFLIVFVLVVSITYANVTSRIDEQLDQALAERREVMHFSPNAMIITYSDGEFDFERFGDYDSNIIQEVLANLLANRKSFVIDGYHFQMKGKRIDSFVGDGYIYAVYDSTGDVMFLRALLVISSLALICAMLIIVGIGWFVSDYNIKPLRESFKKQKELVANASHELKTPLGIISANIGAMTANPESTIKDNQKWIDNVQEQIKRMDTLIKDMLELSRIEADDRKVKKEVFDFSALVGCTTLTMEATAFEKNITLEVNVEDNIFLSAYREETERVIMILLDNALKYTQEGGKITVNLTSNPKQKISQLSVTNTGNGIKKEELNRIFDRFFRADTSRQGDGSFGLGLAIAKASVEKAGGSIICESDGESYSKFSVVYPLVLKK